MTHTETTIEAGQLTVRKTGLGVFLVEVQKLADDHYVQVQVAKVETEDKANEIARACNAHDDLVKALQVLVENGGIGPSAMFHDARDALAKAGVK